MGAGSSCAGAWNAGCDPVAPPSPPRNVRPPAALYFDGATQDFPLDSEGHYEGIDPVDQAVALSLILRLGTVGSVPGIGAAFRSIRRITPATKTTVIAMARDAIRARVQAQDIQIRAVDVEILTRPAGAILVAVSYVNLRRNPPKPTSIRLNVNG